MNDLKVLYITFIDFTTATSGSSLRPQKMLEAFQKIGCDVTLVKGQDRMKGGALERKRSLRYAMDMVKKAPPDICYVENSTSPVKLRQNWQLLIMVKKAGIPIGYFYRDMYYKVPGAMQSPDGFCESIKRMILNRMYLRDEDLLRRYVDVLYLPSKSAASYMAHSDIRTLPPAGEIGYGKELPKAKVKESLYIGGIGNTYGADIMIGAYRILNKKGSYPLTVICRKEEKKIIEQDAGKESWLHIEHASGKALEAYYRRASLCLLPLPKTEYGDLAINIKTMEYLSYGRPIVSTPLQERYNWLKDSGCVKFTRDFSKESFAQTVEEVLTNDILLEQMSKAAIRFVENGNTWEDRAKQVCKELGSLTKEKR